MRYLYDSHGPQHVLEALRSEPLRSESLAATHSCSTGITRRAPVSEQLFSRATKTALGPRINCTVPVAWLMPHHSGTTVRCSPTAHWLYSHELSSASLPLVHFSRGAAWCCTTLCGSRGNAGCVSACHYSFSLLTLFSKGIRHPGATAKEWSVHYVRDLCTVVHSVGT